MRTNCFYAFGKFRLDAGEKVLLRDGRPIPLPPKDLETLLMLVEHRGHIVEKGDLLERVWPGTFVEEGNLARHVSNLRRLLGDHENGNQIIETIPKRGYRFIAPVRSLEQAFPSKRRETSGWQSEQSELTLPQFAAVADRSAVFHRPAAGQKKLGYLSGGILAALVLAAFGLVEMKAPRGIRVSHLTQITHFGRASHFLVADWERLYFAERTGAHNRLVQVSALGGDPQPIPTPFANTLVYDVSPNHNELLVASYDGAERERPLWVMAAIGKTPRRLGDVRAYDAAWSPDGKRIIYANGATLYVVNQDGRGVRKLVTAPGYPLRPRWSPNGRVIRFTTEDAVTGAHSLWEVMADGTGLHPLFPERIMAGAAWGEGDSSGVWSPDGRYYVFRTYRDGAASLWVLRENASFLRGVDHRPVQFFESAFTISALFFSPDGKKLFISERDDSDREMVRYDAGLRQFVPHLSGLSAQAIVYSPDGKWVCYITHPDGAMWRSRADGHDPLQLTVLPLNAFSPSWSPDSKRIAFNAGRNQGPSPIFVIPREGGTAKAVTSGDDCNAQWFPDAVSILYRHREDPSRMDDQKAGFYQLNLKTHERTRLPGSEKMRDPALSPDGRFLAALADDSTALMLFDFKTRQWSALAKGARLRQPSWSRDSQLIYFQDYLQGTEQMIFRFRIANRKLEPVAGSKQFLRADASGGYLLLGLTPDDSPVASLLRAKSDIYALEINFH